MDAPLPRRPRPTTTFASYRWVAAGVAALVAITAVIFVRSRPNQDEILTGYVTGPGVLADESQRYLGRALQSPQLEARMRDAEERVRRHDYAGAAALLEAVLEKAPLPAVYNNLGVLYAEMHDRARALNSFRDGLACDTGYSPIRHNLDRLRQLSHDRGDPVSEEVEPNNTVSSANRIVPNQPVEAEIGTQIDEDSYRIVTPGAPRDILAIKVTLPGKQELDPVLRIYESDGERIDQLGGGSPGESLTHYMSPAPGTTLLLQVSGSRHTTGKYVLTLESMKAYDQYEPNDGIFEARRIEPGAAIDANLMDAADTDYFQFTAPRSGQVSIEILNRSTTLIPALTTFTPDRRHSGFGPDLRTPGESLRHRIQVGEKQTYFIQVWSQGNSSGAYSLKVE